MKQPSWRSTRTPGICKYQMRGQISHFHPDVISHRKRFRGTWPYIITSKAACSNTEFEVSRRQRCLHIRKPPKIPVHIFRYLKTKVSKQSILFFSGVIFPILRGAGVCYLRQKVGSAHMLLLERQRLQFQQEPLFITEAEEEVGKGVPFMSVPFIH